MRSLSKGLLVFVTVRIESGYFCLGDSRGGTGYFSG